MINVYFKLYRDDVIKLARSMVIKFSGIATQINTGIIEEGGTVDPLDPTTWKYYLNLSGLAHYTDKPMFVRSSDTLETIEFNKANLRIHLATLREFYPGSLQYNNLVRQYPNQEQLIRGILFPVDLETAIAAEDGTILFLDNTLVEGNEDDLVERIQDWIRVFIFRWYNPSFNLVDDFNLNAFLGNFYSKLPIAIMNLRFRNVNSIKAHSYYVKEYLASNGRLDEFFEYLDLRQRHWLYRNIRYLKRNSGKQITFNKLVDNILTPKGIPLVSYTLEQESKALLTDLNNDVVLIKHDINFSTTAEDSKESTLREVYDREDVLARENFGVKLSAENVLVNQMGSDRYSSLPTKILDSEVMDRSTSSVKSFNNVLLSEWLHLASTDRYRAYVNIPNPRTGEFMILSAKDAFILMIYCYSKSYGLPVINIPEILAYDVLRPKLPTFNELRDKVSKVNVSDDLIIAMQGLVHPAGSHISTEGFYRACSKIHSNYLKQWEAYSFNEFSVTRSYLEQIVKSHYMHVVCKLTPEPISYELYFREASIDVKDLTNLELRQLTVDCFSIATGTDLVRQVTLSEVQRELLRLMGRLSSYPLQYLRNVNYTDFHVLGTVSTRIADFAAAGSMRYIGNYVNTSLQAVGAKSQSEISISEGIITPTFNYDYEMSSKHHIDPCVDITDLTSNTAHYKMSLGNFGLRGVSITVTPPANQSTDLDEYED